MDLHEMDEYDLIKLYGQLIEELKSRKVIRSKNVIGDIGEYLVIDYYTKTPGLPKLQFAPPSTENIDAISIKGERYSIKCTTSNTTGVFYGLEPEQSVKHQKQLFEYVVIIVLDDNYQLKTIIELDWDAFLRHIKWHSRMKAWHLTISKKLLNDCRIIYEC